MTMPPFSELMQLAWETCPIGIAVIDDRGLVCAINRPLENFDTFDGVSLIGMSESDFVAKIDKDVFDHRRIKSTKAGLRSIHYLQLANDNSVSDVVDRKKVAEAMREPLASIYGFSELLLTQNYDSETRYNLTATLLEQVEHLSNIINESLDDRRLK